jgi:hypothetical protein
MKLIASARHLRSFLINFAVAEGKPRTYAGRFLRAALLVICPEHSGQRICG